MQRSPLLAIVAALALAACDAARTTDPAEPASIAAARSTSASPQRTTLVGGLLYPRGIAFGKEGMVYVAEAGTPAGNTISSGTACKQVIPPVGPYLGGYTGRISRIDRSGNRTTVVSGLPSAIEQLGDVVGPSDVAFVGDKLYALVDGGCSHGHTDFPASIIRVNDDGSWTRAANLSAWILNPANETAHPQAADYEPDGSWYNMFAAGGVLYAVEANHGSLITVKPNPGNIERVVDVSAVEGKHVVPTGAALVRDDILVGELTPFPAVAGNAHVLRFARNGRLEQTLGGFTAVLGVAQDDDRNTYVLESFTCTPPATSCFPSPGSGRITKIARDGTRSTFATGFSFPTALRLGPDEALYVSNFGYGPPGMGEIIRLAIP